MEQIYSRPPFCEEVIKLLDIVNSFSLFTNSSIFIYDYIKNSIIYANLSGAINFKIENKTQPEVELQNHIGQEELQFLKKICDTKLQFFKRINIVDRSNWVISGKIINNNRNIKELDVSLLGSTIAFTPDGNIRYELFKTYIVSGKDAAITMYNGKTGERWEMLSDTGKWLKMQILKFSELEKQVISLSIAGFSSKQIAEITNHSEICIKKSKSRIMQSVNASTMTEAIFKLSHYKFM